MNNQNITNFTHLGLSYSQENDIIHVYESERKKNQYLNIPVKFAIAMQVLRGGDIENDRQQIVQFEQIFKIIQQQPEMLQ